MAAAGVVVPLAVLSSMRIYVSAPLDFVLAIFRGPDLALAFYFAIAGALAFSAVMLWRAEPGALPVARWTSRAMVLLFPIGTILGVFFLRALRSGGPVAESFVRENPLPPPPFPPAA